MRRCKNYLPPLILIILLWAIFAFLALFVEPTMVKDILIPGTYLPFFLNLFLALTFTLAIIFGNSKRGLIVAFACVTFLFLRVVGLGNWLNLALIIGICISLEGYFTKKR